MRSFQESICLLAIASIVAVIPEPATAADEIVGRATVIDGDTIEIAGERIRLDGIDAPESRQHCVDERGAKYACDRQAAHALDRQLASSRPTRCVRNGHDRYGRTIATCFLSSGIDVAAWLVRNGHALDWPRYSNGRYANEQHAAEAERRGMWRGQFDAPWDWRRR